MRYLITVLLALSLTAVAAVPAAAYSPIVFNDAIMRYIDGTEPDLRLIARGIRRDKPALIVRGLRRHAKDLVVVARWLGDHRPNACQARPTEVAKQNAFRAAKYHRLEAKAVERRAWSAALRNSRIARKAEDRFATNVLKIYECAMS